MFDVPAQLIRAAPSDPIITVPLSDDPKVTAQGRVREVAPQANPVTRTFEVKVGLTDPPEAMRLGATVIGRMELPAVSVFEIPASALTRSTSSPRSGSSIRKAIRSRCVTSMWSRFDQNQVIGRLRARRTATSS